jgi:hypothetical protein
MHATFGSTFAERVFLPPPAPAGSFADATFGASPAEVRLRVSRGGTTVERVPLDVVPTAVARRAGTSDTLYVVGLREATAQVVVERWVLPLDPAEPRGADGRSDGRRRPVARYELWASSPGQLPPVWDAACNPFGPDGTETNGSLWMLAGGEASSLWHLDLQTLEAERALASTDTGLGDLGACRSLMAGRSPGDGFLVVAQRKRPWDSGADFSASDHDVIVLHDADEDGTFESVTAMTWPALQAAYPLNDWDMRYSE